MFSPGEKTRYSPSGDQSTNCANVSVTRRTPEPSAFIVYSVWYGPMSPVVRGPGRAPVHRSRAPSEDGRAGAVGVGEVDIRGHEVGALLVPVGDPPSVRRPGWVELSLGIGGDPPQAGPVGVDDVHILGARGTP